MTWLRVAILALFLLLLFVAPEPDPDYLLLRSSVELYEEIAASLEGTPPGDVRISLAAENESLAASIRKEYAERLSADRLDPDGTGPLLEIEFHREEGAGRAVWRVGDGPEQSGRASFVDWKSLLPPFAAIVTALLIQRTILALSFGVWLGSTLLTGYNPIAGLWRFLRVYVIEQAILDSFRLEIIGFVIGLVALVGIINRGGGVQGMIGMMMRFIRSRRSAQLVSFFMGLVIFFDDYANTILVGSTMRPLTDRFRISREKLSYLVDSTAAPVAGLSLLSTWIAYEVSQFAPQILEVGITESPYLVFARTIPYRYYSIFTLVFIFSGILMRREFGPMLAAERRAKEKGELIRPGARPMITGAMNRVVPKEGIPLRWVNGLLPLATVVAVTLAMLWITGNRALDEPKPLTLFFSLEALREVISGASSTRAIVTGAWSGFFLAVILMASQRILSPGEIVRASFNSTRALFFAIVIFVLAWCIGGVCQDLGTAHFLVALFRQALSPLLYPMVLFILACLVSFSTGSSWSTMAIILPNSVALAFLLGAGSPVGSFGLTVLSIGAVLEGSIFGDHCSPISDTTILSSVSSAADHMDHVRTQIPYAVTTAAIALSCGYLPATRGFPAWAGLLLGVAAILLVHRTLGKSMGEEKPQST